ncbi:MAG: VOC family protein [Solirubrobacterales bacterium]
MTDQMQAQARAEAPATPAKAPAPTKPAAGERRHVLPDDLRLGAAHITVADLDEAVPFYTHVLGLRQRERVTGDGGETTASLTAGGDHDLVVLHEKPGARAVTRHSGLYHVALLYPSRLELARVAQRIQHTGTPIQGASDHGISWAIYLPDPSGNGIELAADQPPETWPDLSNVDSIAPRPLDLGGLFNLVGGREPEPDADPATRIGHVHLHVGDIGQGLAFYRDIIGFDLVTHIPGVAAFVSAGGYHHHLGINTWQGRGAPPAPPDAAGLHHWNVVLPSGEDVAAVRARLAGAGHETADVGNGFEVRDPWNIAMRVVSSAVAHDRQG